MNNHRLLTGLLAAAFWSGGVCAVGQTKQVFTIEDLFEVARNKQCATTPVIIRRRRRKAGNQCCRSGRLPDIEANLSLSYIGDGFTTKRNFSDYQKAPIPHFGNAFGINITQPVYTGGAISAGVEMAELKSTASRYATELQRDNIRFQLTGFYLTYTSVSICAQSWRIISCRPEKVLEEMNARYEQGTALQNDITRYGTACIKPRTATCQDQQYSDNPNRNLVVTAGLEDNIEVVPDSTILVRSLPSVGEDWWQQSAESESPTLKLARSGWTSAVKPKRL